MQLTDEGRRVLEDAEAAIQRVRFARDPDDRTIHFAWALVLEAEGVLAALLGEQEADDGK